MSDPIPDDVKTREGMVLYIILKEIQNDLVTTKATVTEVRASQIARSTIEEHDRRLKVLEGYAAFGKSVGAGILQKFMYAVIAVVCTSDIVLKILAAMKHGLIP